MDPTEVRAEVRAEVRTEVRIEARLQAIADAGRRTRKPTPRWLWAAAAVFGGICTVGFAIGMLAEPAPSTRHLEQHRPAAGGVGGESGLGIGLVIGAGVGIVIGFSIARHRGGHSSRNSP
ncbi:MAG TPA: hypothetical protein VH165_14610 [Kofleriaceae bacterium]|nr:hypothetical protein [Kofleriaceae bacterium]